MKCFSPCLSTVGIAAILIGALNANAAVQVITEFHKAPGQAEEPLYYLFNNVPVNSSTDLANGIMPTIIGTLAPASAPASVLTDGPGAAAGNSITANLFFHDPIPSPKVIILDLGSVKPISQVNSYSWHVAPSVPGDGLRAPQDFDLFVSTGVTLGFDSNNIGSPGWTMLATVDSEVAGGAVANAGQHGVSISDTTGALGNFRYVALNVRSPFGYANTFYSEIDVVGVPEPSTIGLVIVGLLGFGLRNRRKCC